MDVLPTFLRTALDGSEARLERAARATAIAGTHGEPAAAQLAGVARAAIFTDALLAAAHARLADLKTAARNG